jgi:hypothetical protein
LPRLAVAPRVWRRPLAALVLLSCLLIGSLAPHPPPPLGNDLRAHHLASAVRVVICPVATPGALSAVKDGEATSFAQHRAMSIKGERGHLTTFALDGTAHIRGHCSLQPGMQSKLLRVVATWEADLTMEAGRVRGTVHLRPLHRDADPLCPKAPTQWIVANGTARLTRGHLRKMLRTKTGGPIRYAPIDDLRVRMVLKRPDSPTASIFWTWAPTLSSTGNYTGPGGLTMESRLDRCVTRRAYGITGQGRFSALRTIPTQEDDSLEQPLDLIPKSPPDPWRDSHSLVRDLTMIQDACQARVTGVTDLPPMGLLGVLDHQPGGIFPVPLLLQPQLPPFWHWLTGLPHTETEPGDMPVELLRHALPGPAWHLEHHSGMVQLTVGNYLANIPLTPVSENFTRLPPWDPSTEPEVPLEPAPGSNTILLLSAANTRKSTVTGVLQRLLTADIRLTPVTAPGDELAPIFWTLCAASGAAVAQLLSPRAALAAGAGVLTIARALCPDPLLVFLLGLLSWAAGVGGSTGLVRWRRMLPKTTPLPDGVLNQFDDITPIARGGMGIVYHAIRAETGTGVHIKMMLDEARLDPECQLRFQREMRALAQLSHPNVVRILEHEGDGIPYYVMEEFSSETLEKLLTRAAPLPEREVLRIGIGLCDGLAAVHAAGIIHRDVKPDNVLVSPSGDVQLIDFGLAMIEGMTRLTREDGFHGTLRYMAPELLAGSSPTAASDLYSLGLVLYRSITGQLPYAENTVDKITYAALKSPSTLAPGVSAATAAHIQRCLAPPATRWACAADLAAALRQTLEEQFPA